MCGGVVLLPNVAHNVENLCLTRQINEAFELLHKGDCLRCVLSFD